MKNHLVLSTVVWALYVKSALADPGISSLEGLWIFFLVIGLIIAVLLTLGGFWLRITYLYLRKRRERFHRLKTYLFLSITISLISGISAFTFHVNAPYSPNIYFLATTILVIAASVFALVVQYKN